MPGRQAPARGGMKQPGAKNAENGKTAQESAQESGKTDEGTSSSAQEQETEDAQSGATASGDASSGEGKGTKAARKPGHDRRGGAGKGKTAGTSQKLQALRSQIEAMEDGEAKQKLLDTLSELEKALNGAEGSTEAAPSEQAPAAGNAPSGKDAAQESAPQATEKPVDAA
jgi:hypothetical protein